MRLLPFLIVVPIAWLAACATQQRSDSLTTTLNAYANTVRWGDLQNTELYVDPKQRKSPSAATLADYKRLRVSEYDEGDGPLPAGPDQVTQVVHISLVDNSTQVERSIVDHQTWHYDAASKHWWLESGPPNLEQP